MEGLGAMPRTERYGVTKQQQQLAATRYVLSGETSVEPEKLEPPGNAGPESAQGATLNPRVGEAFVEARAFQPIEARPCGLPVRSKLSM